MGFTVKTFPQLVSDMVAYIVANSPQITDLTPGSVIRSFCEAAGLTLEELYVSTYLGFRRYLGEIPENIFSFVRKDGTKATVNVIFSRAGSSGEVTAPIGTAVKTSSGITFVTTALATIPNAASDSNAVEAEAEEIGPSYNVLANTITTIVDDIDDIETVDNALAATGGVAAETDFQYKQRFQNYIEGLGKANIAGLIAGALSVDGITSASVLEYFPPSSNVNARLYIDDGSVDGVSVTQVSDMQDLIDGDGSESSPGYRAAGVNVIVAAPGILTQGVTLTATVLLGVDTDQAETDINSALTTYINNLGIGSDIIYNELIAAVMGVYGVTDCDITDPTAPGTTVLSTQVGRLGTLSVTIS